MGGFRVGFEVVKLIELWQGRDLPQGDVGIHVSALMVETG